MDILAETSSLCVALEKLAIPRGVAVVLNPLRYAWGAHRRWLQRFVSPLDTAGRPVVRVHGIDNATTVAQRRRVLIVGMNPGPHGMMQTGVPFGDVVSARELLGLTETFAPRAGSTSLVETPQGFAGVGSAKLKREVNGFAHRRVEESGRRLWGVLSELWGGLDNVVADCFVMNLCPLAYFAEDGSNVTPDDLDDRDRGAMLDPCLTYLRKIMAAMRPTTIVAVGRWVELVLEARDSALVHADPWSWESDVYSKACADGYQPPRVVYLPHPSPRSAAQAAAWSQQAAAVLGPLATTPLTARSP